MWLGEYTVQLLVNDGTADSAPDTVTISTQNSQPVADAGLDQTLLVGSLVQLEGSSSTDADNDPLSFQWSFLSVPVGSAAILSNVTSATPTFTADLVGPYEVQLIVNDGSEDSDLDTVLIQAFNTQPLADAGPDQTVFVAETVDLNGSSSSDADGDPLTYLWSLSSIPAGSAASLDDPTAVNPTFVVDQPGMYVVQLLVNDGREASDPDTVTISTQNSQPVADAGDDQTAFVTDPVQLDGSNSSDVDNDPLTFSWGFIGNPSDSTATLDDPTSPTPTFTVDKPGAYTLELLVNDGTVESDPDTVTISTQNSKPVADAGPDQDVFVTDTVQLDGMGSNDVDGDPLMYDWTLLSVPQDSTATFDDPTSETPSFEVDKAGTYVGQLIVNDGTEDSDPDTVTITTQNTKPVAQIAGLPAVFVTDTLPLDGSGSSDIDDDPLTFQWTLQTKPANSTAALDDPTSQTPSFVADKAGTYEVQLIVNDGTVDSDPVTVSIATQNTKPTAVISAIPPIFVGNPVPLDGSGSNDVDDDSLTFAWTMLSVPAGSSATLDDPTNASPSFVADTAGSYTVQLIVNDGTVESDPVTEMMVTQNSPPVANAGGDQSVVLGDTVQLDGSGSSDIDGNSLSFAWTLMSVPAGSSVVLSDPTSVNPTFVPDLAGSYDLQLLVNDGSVDSAPATVSITVLDPATTDDDGDGVSENDGDCDDTDPNIFPGSTAACYDGPAGTEGVGICQAGIRTCQADGTFSACTGQVLPGTEIPGNGLDEDCDGADASLPIPPDPSTVAPAVDPTVASSVFATTQFLYTGADPIQTGVAPGTIAPQRAAVVRGQVTDRAGTPLSGVTVSILHHPEYGQTLTRADGMFDLVVNGGGLLTLTYDKPGLFTAQRQVDVAWQDYDFVDDVALIPPDPQVTTVDLSDPSTPMQVAQGSLVTDDSGTRQATVLFPQGTQAEMVLPDGSTQALTTLNIRATEYTVGDLGPEAMPGALPPSSAYTYAVELSADEALTAGATQVRFYATRAPVCRQLLRLSGRDGCARWRLRPDPGRVDARRQWRNHRDRECGEWDSGDRYRWRWACRGPGDADSRRDHGSRTEPIGHALHARPECLAGVADLLLTLGL